MKVIIMKQMTCAQMGGPADCHVEIQGETAQEMSTNGVAHVMAAHPDLAEQLKGMSDEQNANWMNDFIPKFEAAPTVE